MRSPQLRDRPLLRLLAALEAHWSRHLFGRLPVKDDRHVTAEDRARYDLVLFGDPGSNALVA